MRQPLRVLLVEFDSDIALLMRQALERAGHQVTRCATAADALEVLRRFSPVRYLMARHTRGLLRAGSACLPIRLPGNDTGYRTGRPNSDRAPMPSCIR